MKKAVAAFFFFLILFRASAQIYDTLPVIFHIINNGENVGTGTNISQLQVNSQFDVLNEDYRMLNADISQTPSVWVPLEADMGLNFDKALFDPNGNPLTEPGIDRINRVSMGWSAPPYNLSYIESFIKAPTIWDPKRYLNIWVMNLANGLLGYCTFPDSSGLGCLPVNSGTDSLHDGIVLHYSATGRVGNVIAPFNLGRTATYEIAQWLGLRRLAQVSCGDDCVPDTPVGDYNDYGCPVFPQTSTCNPSPDGDMFMNFMSYVDDGCKVMFTLGQKQRIDTCLTNGVYQSALRLSNANSPMGIKTHSSFVNVAIFPNPSAGNISILLSQKMEHRVRIYSMLGELVFESPAISELKQDIAVVDIANGIYTLEVVGDEGLLRKKIMIER